jgi:hypothetical protein
MEKSLKMMLMLFFVAIATLFGEVVHGARILNGDPPLCDPQPEACILNPKCCPGHHPPAGFLIWGVIHLM